MVLRFYRRPWPKNQWSQFKPIEIHQVQRSLEVGLQETFMTKTEHYSSKLILRKFETKHLSENNSPKTYLNPCASRRVGRVGSSHAVAKVALIQNHRWGLFGFGEPVFWQNMDHWSFSCRSKHATIIPFNKIPSRYWQFLYLHDPDELQYIRVPFEVISRIGTLWLPKDALRVPCCRILDYGSCNNMATNNSKCN